MEIKSIYYFSKFFKDNFWSLSPIAYNIYTKFYIGTQRRSEFQNYFKEIRLFYTN